MNMFETFVYVTGMMIVVLLMFLIGVVFALMSKFDKAEKKIENSINILNNTIINHSRKDDIEIGTFDYHNGDTSNTQPDG